MENLEGVDFFDALGYRLTGDFEPGDVYLIKIKDSDAYYRFSDWVRNGEGTFKFNFYDDLACVRSSGIFMWCPFFEAFLPLTVFVRGARDVMAYITQITREIDDTDITTLLDSLGD